MAAGAAATSAGLLSVVLDASDFCPKVNEKAGADAGPLAGAPNSPVVDPLETDGVLPKRLLHSFAPVPKGCVSVFVLVAAADEPAPNMKGLGVLEAAGVEKLNIGFGVPFEGGAGLPNNGLEVPLVSAGVALPKSDFPGADGAVVLLLAVPNLMPFSGAHVLSFFSVTVVDPNVVEVDPNENSGLGAALGSSGLSSFDSSNVVTGLAKVKAEAVGLAEGLNSNFNPESLFGLLSVLVLSNENGEEVVAPVELNTNFNEAGSVDEGVSSLGLLSTSFFSTCFGAPKANKGLEGSDALGGDEEKRFDVGVEVA